MMSTLSKLGRDLGQAIAAPVCPAIFDRDRAALNPTEVVEPPRECGRRSLSAKGVLSPKNPTIGRFPGCCAPATIGHAAAPPSTVMNSRLFIDRTAFDPTSQG
jgi:hypothetical protein